MQWFTTAQLYTAQDKDSFATKFGDLFHAEEIRKNSTFQTDKDSIRITLPGKSRFVTEKKNSSPFLAVGVEFMFLYNNTKSYRAHTVEFLEEKDICRMN